ncbi:hypothetical protein [Chthonomonas calidirosea]|uniref:hypothetical protein n=1 Tax=Chthonomonas calidirosea TaxID=454171 RepID=UPI001E380D06|nr:hypothetical protein [Chthonomonas calidirosea]
MNRIPSYCLKLPLLKCWQAVWFDEERRKQGVVDWEITPHAHDGMPLLHNEFP